MATVQDLPKTINGVNVDDLFTTILGIKAAPAIAKFTFHIENQWAEGSQNSSTVDRFNGAGQELSRPRPFVLTADEPPVLLGKDTAANPVEHLLHALASCLTTSMVYHSAARGIQIEEVESIVEGDIDIHGFLELDKSVRQGYQGIRVSFKIKADVPDERLQEIVQLGTGHSPVFDSLTNGVPVLKASPSGALSSVVPTDDCQRIFPALRSTATSAPHGGLLHNPPRLDFATTRVIANGAPRCGPKSLPGGVLKPSASARGINLTICTARLVLA